MSEANKVKKVINSIGMGLLAALSSGVVVPQVASAAELDQIQDNGDLLNGNQQESQNQETVDALESAGEAIDKAQGAITEAGDIANGTEMQGKLDASADALGQLDKAVAELEEANREAADAVEDYENAVGENQYRDNAAENIADAKEKAEAAEDIANQNKEAAEDLAEKNQTAQKEQYDNQAEANAAQNAAEQCADELFAFIGRDELRNQIHKHRVHGGCNDGAKNEVFAEHDP